MSRQIALWTFCILLALARAVFADSPPDHHTITGITGQTQINGLTCGVGALETVLEYFGPGVDPKSVADVARTTSYGTYSFDLIRTGHFSSLSAAQGDYYPHAIPTAGFPNRPLGLAAFSHNASTPWLDQARELVAQNIPVIMLMNFTPEPDSGAHYRVLVGYDDRRAEAYFIDPWGRNLQQGSNADGTITWSYNDLLAAWNYTGYGSDHPYWGGAIFPWKVTLATQGKIKAGNTITVRATITYPCPQPFNCTEFPTSSVTAQLDLPNGMRLTQGGSTRTLGNLAAGGTTTSAWTITVDSIPTNRLIGVTASGQIQGSVPIACGTGNGACYPGYWYIDRIGGSGSLAF